MDTGDEYDFQFYPINPSTVSANNDKMTIGQGRAMVGINRSTTTPFFMRGALTAAEEIDIYAGALQLAAGAATVATMLSLV